MLCQFLLYNKVNQLYVYMYPHIPSLLRFPPTLPIPPLQVVTKHRADLPLCYAAASHQLSILHLVVYLCQCYSLTSPQLPLPPCVIKSVLYVYVFILALLLGSFCFVLFCFVLFVCFPLYPQVLQYHFFRFHIYALAYSICFSLSDLLYSVSSWNFS